MDYDEKYIDIDLKYIDVNQINDYDELIYLMPVFDTLIGTISDQLRREKEIPAEDRDWSWYNSAKTALKSTKIKRTMCAERKGYLRREEKKKDHLSCMASNRNQEKEFIKVAKVLLAPDVYSKIWDNVYLHYPEFRN